ncbi:MAG TPA: methionine--tRNA ligase [Kofleriaceae bacterium]|nr:methionine--tRNA ligase [Kofleriaceae bacterium]
MTSASPYYVATAIPYVNARPHIGFALEVAIADAIARHRRRRGRDVLLVTGTDEHSLKNVLAAERAGTDTADWVARHAESFRALWPALGAVPDEFVRTSTDPRHRIAVEALWRRLAAAGDLHRGAYRGLYCVGCERFVEPDELAAGLCPEHGAPPEEIAEDNWFFRLGRHAPAVRDAIVSGRLVVEPASAREETLAFLSREVRDLSVSRSAARARGWGIAVPGDPDQVVYVWVDALAYYLAALDWGRPGADPDRFARYWAGDGERVHVVGKGITRFHTVIWPALLLAAGLPLPTHVLVHGHVTVDGVKIAKSGISVDPVPLAARHGADVVRHTLLRHIRTTRDGDFREERLEQAHDAELANQLGNLVQRAASLAHRLCGGRVPHRAGDDPERAELRGELLALPGRVDAAIDRFCLDDAIGAVFAAGLATNRYLERTAPWSRARAGDHAGAAAAVRAALDAVAALAGELGPFLPATSEAILGCLAADGAAPVWRQLRGGAPIAQPLPLFPRRRAG